MRSRTTTLAPTISSVETTPSSPDISFDVSSTSACPWRSSLLRNTNTFLSRWSAGLRSFARLMRQHAAEHLANHALRQLVPERDARRHLVRREPLSAPGTQFL